MRVLVFYRISILKWANVLMLENFGTVSSVRIPEKEEHLKR